jgi:hypothetical protein
MGIIDFFTEQFYILFSIYYYEVFLYENKVQVGRFIQALSFNPAYMVNFKRKLAWAIIPNTGFVKGHKIIQHYNLKDALPLLEITEESIKELNWGILQIQKTIKLIADVSEEQINKAKPKVLINSYNFPPHMIFELFNATFVTKTVSSKKGTNWELVIYATLICIGIIAFMLIMVFGVFHGSGTTIPTVKI